MMVVVVTLCILEFVTGCPPRFQNPLPIPAELKFDAGIAGSWWRSIATDEQQVMIYPRRDGWADIVYVYGINSTFYRDGINVLVCEGYTTLVGKERFLCVRRRKKDVEMCKGAGEPEQLMYVIFNYYLSKERNLVLKGLANQKLVKLIKENKLSGRIYEEDVAAAQFETEVLITSSSNELADVLSTKGLQALISEDEEDLMIFTRKRGTNRITSGKDVTSE